MHVAAYIEQHPGSPQTIKQHLAAIKMLFDYLVVSQIVPTNPAAPVKGPTHVVKRGKTPVLSVEDARTLLASIPTDSLEFKNQLLAELIHGAGILKYTV